MQMQVSQQKNMSTFMMMVVVALLAFCIAQPSLAADLFADGKDTIKDTAGSDSAVEMAMLTAGALGAAVLGFTTRSWYAAIGGFAGGLIFWEVIKPLVGLA